MLPDAISDSIYIRFFATTYHIWTVILSWSSARFGKNLQTGPGSYFFLRRFFCPRPISFARRERAAA